MNRLNLSQESVNLAKQELQQYRHGNKRAEKNFGFELFKKVESKILKKQIGMLLYGPGHDKNEKNKCCVRIPECQII